MIFEMLTNTIDALCFQKIKKQNGKFDKMSRTQQTMGSISILKKKTTTSRILIFVHKLDHWK